MAAHHQELHGATRSSYPEVVVIKFLAQVFRGLHYIVGISEPPAGTSDRTFVFAWLGGIAFMVVFAMILMYYIAPFLYPTQ